MNSWINVEDKLPPVGEKVLVYATGKDGAYIGDNVLAIISMSDTNPFWTNLKTEPYWRDPWHYFSLNYEITHWMAMPEKPRTDKVTKAELANALECFRMKVSTPHGIKCEKESCRYHCGGHWENDGYCAFHDILFEAVRALRET